MNLSSFAYGKWISPETQGTAIKDASTGEVLATVSSDGLDFKAMLEFGREHGGPALQQMTFHERALLLKELALYLSKFKDELYDISYQTGATKADTWIDVDGGIQTFFVYSSKGRRELPNQPWYVDGDVEQLSRNGSFIGQHIMVPRRGVALHIDAYNFPVWGMMEKLAPTLLAGMPAIVKPASSTAQLTEQAVKRMIESGILPEGALQLISGRTGDLFDHLTCQDIVTFTGSAATAHYLQNHPAIIKNAVPFVAECDSLNCSILGPDAVEGSEEFDLFVKEVAREVTTKAGQKCTAIRRSIVPRGQVEAVKKALVDRLKKVTVGDPRAEGVRMGPLASLAQRQEVVERVAELSKEAEIVLDGTKPFDVVGAHFDSGAFVGPTVLCCDQPLQSGLIHEVEAFGPVTTLMPYDSLDEAIELANKGEGSLVASLFTFDPEVVFKVTMGVGAYHGRLVVLDRTSAGESTGHGSPLPHMKHGGPGRAGGGEEQGGIRAVKHYLQRVAIQGSPDVLTTVTNRWAGGTANTMDAHPFRKSFDEIKIGDALYTKPRVVTLEDVEHFANFTGDTFYAHMDEEAATANPIFGGRVAHGYLLLSFAAGLFVDPAPGPVLANVGLENLRFTKPVYPGDTMYVRLVCMQRTARENEDFGEVRWDVTVTNQDDEECANYELLTHNTRVQ
ncbi:phenylacetic acid degradation bifunctional protein PaaZ [Temperatibacter marinus]|uniref:Phenylacetic acid degradation bifunctional protein PaaZ n=1 Tax=Temperatibacter marinus TaxID=1456591 RepID=A0AA52EFB9_9PROT|nr:phenylacetic acid degradation bifunctional protein PaaZ [Temperatibacter marinus]WND01482.1 phenylacetic acid degradation bifunctional protein PaaZ [Temperatibacter marinus]